MNSKLTIAEANLLLNEISAEDLDEILMMEYEEMLDAIFAEHEMEMYAAQSYNYDARVYGEM